MTDKQSVDRTDLFNRARQGDMDALGVLLKSFRNNLRKLASVRNDKDLRRKIDTSDVLQEIEMQAIGDFPSFRGESIGELVNWLHQILKTKRAKARRTWEAQIRDVRRERTSYEFDDHSDDPIMALSQNELTEPKDRMIQLEEAASLFEALAGLPDTQQAVVNMHYFEGLSMREVGNRIGKSENAIQKLWARALVKLGQRISSCVSEELQ